MFSFLMKLVFRMFVWLVVMAGGFHFLRPLGYADFFFLLGLFLVGFAVSVEPSRLLGIIGPVAKITHIKSLLIDGVKIERQHFILGQRHVDHRNRFVHTKSKYPRLAFFNRRTGISHNNRIGVCARVIELFINKR